MGFHIYTDSWWRKPKHAVTTDATLVEVTPPKRPTFAVSSAHPGFIDDSAVYGRSPGGYVQSVVADVTDPRTGQIVRAHGELFSDLKPFEAGQRLRVRWSAKRKEITAYSRTTAPEEDQVSDVNAGEKVRGVRSVQLSGAELSPDRVADVQQALSALVHRSFDACGCHVSRKPARQ